MANVAHSTLTGANLHEPKGIASANADELYFADGAGSGEWLPDPDPFSKKLFHIRNQQAAEANGASLTSGIWNTRVLNTSVTNEISGASLSSNGIILPSGTYYCRANASIYQDSTVGGTQLFSLDKLRLYNNTTSSTILVGMPHRDRNGTTGVSLSFCSTRSLYGRFTLAGTSTLYLQHYLDSSMNNLKLEGFGAGGSEVEVFADVHIWKLS